MILTGVEGVINYGQNGSNESNKPGHMLSKSYGFNAVYVFPGKVSESSNHF
jgi:hypothetical protein